MARIAAALGRHRSTIHREIARNWWRDAEVPQAEGYWPLTAQDLAGRRRRMGAKLERHAELRDAVVDRLRAGWSPEQIAGRLRIEPEAPYRLCHETRLGSSRAPRARARNWPVTCRSGAGVAARGSPESREAPSSRSMRGSGTGRRRSVAALSSATGSAIS